MMLACTRAAPTADAPELKGVQRYATRAETGIRSIRVGPCGLDGEPVAETRDGLHFRIRIDKARRRVRLEPIPVCPGHEPPHPPEMLPDGEVAEGDGDVAAAWLAEPTRRYGHGVLGDAVEAGALRLRLRDGTRLEYRLEAGAVFEDRYPRLADLDGDGRSELLVVRSGLEEGAALALFGVEEGELRLLAESEPFGRRNRWLNPAGIADFDGDGRPEIAAVLTPHIGGTLTLYERQGDRLVPERARDGFSNHALGTRELGLSAVLDADGDGTPDLAVPGADRESLRIVSFAGGRFRELLRLRHDGEIGTAIVAVDVDGNGLADLVYALETGEVVVLVR